jgi:hypothetical protein
VHGVRGQTDSTKIHPALAKRGLSAPIIRARLTYRQVRASSAMPSEAKVSYLAGKQQERTTMAEIITNDRPPVASRPRPRKPATVSASALALHLDCSRTYIGKLEAEGVIQRQDDGFLLDQSRVAYLRHLRREHRRSRRTEADAAHVEAKTEMLKLTLMEKKHELVRRADVDALIDGIAGITLTALSSLPARCAQHGDLATRRSIERVVFEVRTKIATLCQQMADKNGEPPLSAREDPRGSAAMPGVRVSAIRHQSPVPFTPSTAIHSGLLIPPRVRQRFSGFSQPRPVRRRHVADVRHQRLARVQCGGMPQRIKRRSLVYGDDAVQIAHRGEADALFVHPATNATADRSPKFWSSAQLDCCRIRSTQSGKAQCAAV